MDNMKKKIKVATLTGAELDYWVAKADDLIINKLDICPRWLEVRSKSQSKQFAIGVVILDPDERKIFAESSSLYSPSTDWSQGGPIIENEKIKHEPIYSGTEWKFVEWRAKSLLYRFEMSGPTALIAAMRFYVANRIGEEVDEI